MFQFGSGAEYGFDHYLSKMLEDYFDRNVPADTYGFMKYCIAKYIACQTYMVDLRLFGVFGKYEDYRFKFISNAIVKNLLHLPIVIARNVVFDYLDINDLCDIMIHLLKDCDSIPYRHLNMTPCMSMSLVDIAKIINATSDYQSEIIVINDHLGREYSGNNARLMEMLGAYEFRSMDSSIRQLRAYYETRLSELDADAVRKDEYLNSCLKKSK